MFRKWPLWLYSLANLANSLASTTVSSYAIFFYTDALHVPARLIGQAWFVFGIWNTVNDLLFGWISDRIPARLGRRVFLMLLFALPVGIAYFFLWTPPGFARGSEITLAIYFLLMISLYDTCQSAVTVSQGAVFPELATNSNDRAKLSAFRQVMGIVGITLAFVLSPIIYGKLGWPALGAIWGGVIALLYYVAAIGVRHQVTIKHQSQVVNTKSWWANVRGLMLNRPFILLMILNFMIRFSIACLQIGMPFYARYALGVSNTGLAIVLGGTLLAAALAIPLWPLLMRWLGPRKTAMIVIVLMIGLLIPLVFTTHLGAVIPLTILLGPAYSGIHIVLDMFYAQVVDQDLLKSGQSRAGMIGGVLGTMLRFSPAVAGLAIGELLTFSRYDPLLVTQPDQAQFALRAIMTLLPIVTLVVSMIVLYFYPIHGKRQKELEASIAKVYA